jgi:hypothetical protein
VESHHVDAASDLAPALGLQNDAAPFPFPMPVQNSKLYTCRCSSGSRKKNDAGLCGPGSTRLILPVMTTSLFFAAELSSAGMPS